MIFVDYEKGGLVDTSNEFCMALIVFETLDSPEEPKSEVRALASPPKTSTKRPPPKNPYPTCAFCSSSIQRLSF